MRSHLRSLEFGYGLAVLILFADPLHAAQTALSTQNQANAALLKAATEGDLTRVRSLVHRGAQVNAQDAFYRTPLHLAAEQGHVAILRFLLDHGAAMEARDRDGNIPLLTATDEGQIRAVRFLLYRGAYLFAKNAFGSDALWLTGRDEQPNLDAAPAVRKLLLARIRQAKRHEAANARLQRQLKPLYDRYAEAYRTKDWKTVAALLTPHYTFYDWDGGSSSRIEWLQGLRQQREENPDYPFWFVLEQATAHGRTATARVVVLAHYIWRDTWRKTARGWRLQHTQMWGLTVEPPPPSSKEKSGNSGAAAARPPNR